MRVHTFKEAAHEYLTSHDHLWQYKYFFINYIIFLKAHTSLVDTNLFLSAFQVAQLLDFPMLLGKVC